MKKILRNAIISIVFALIAVGCTVPVVVKNSDGTDKTNPDGTPVVEHQIDPRLGAGLNFVGTAAGAVPQPWGWIIGAGAAAVAGVTQTLANRKNKQVANQHKTEAEKWNDIATTIIQGVEAAGAEAAKVKESIANRARSDGNSTLVDQAVQEELRT